MILLSQEGPGRAILGRGHAEIWIPSGKVGSSGGFPPLGRGVLASVRGRSHRSQGHEGQWSSPTPISLFQQEKQAGPLADEGGARLCLHFLISDSLRLL